MFRILSQISSKASTSKYSLISFFLHTENISFLIRHAYGLDLDPSRVSILLYDLAAGQYTQTSHNVAVVVHEELKKVNVIVKAQIKFGENVLSMLKETVDRAVHAILNE
jgi:hypothetical protein